MTIDLASVATALPDELRARRAADGDLERRVEFQNRFATPGQWTAPAAARHFQEAHPQTLELALLVEHASGEIVATGETSEGFMRSPDGSWHLSLRVAPPWRRRGIANALLDPLEAHGRANGAQRLVVAVRGTDPDGARFAEHHGYRAFHERIDGYIDVPSFDASRFEDPDATVGRIGLRLATYADVVDEHAGDLEAFQRAMFANLWAMARDIPSATPMPETPPPFEMVRRMLFEGPGIDPATSILALRGNDVVGVTITTLKETGTAYTNLTGVLRSERGKGVALALKLRALRELKQRGVKLFGTTNDEKNAAMRSVNAKLGYVPDPPTTMYEKKLG